MKIESNLPPEVLEKLGYKLVDIAKSKKEGFPPPESPAEEALLKAIEDEFNKAIAGIVDDIRDYLLNKERQ